jgi:hypothetical protein
LGVFVLAERNEILPAKLLTCVPSTRKRSLIEKPAERCVGLLHILNDMKIKLHHYGVSNGANVTAIYSLAEASERASVWMGEEAHHIDFNAPFLPCACFVISPIISRLANCQLLLLLPLEALILPLSQ